MDYQKRLQSIVDKVPSKCITKNIKAFHKDLYQYILNTTQFLNENCKFTERIYCNLNDLTSIPKCLYCKKKEVKFINMVVGYNKYCSKKCGNYNPLIQRNREQSFIEKYGVKYPVDRKSVV